MSEGQKGKQDDWKGAGEEREGEKEYVSMYSFSLFPEISMNMCFSC